MGREFGVKCGLKSALISSSIDQYISTLRYQWVQPPSIKASHPQPPAGGLAALTFLLSTPLDSLDDHHLPVALACIIHLHED
jgi:hypothetical protein